MRHGTVAVELDLVQPRFFRMLAVGRVRHLRGKLRLDAIGRIGPFRALDRAGFQACGLRRGLRLLDQFLYPAARLHALGAHGQDVGLLVGGEVAFLEQQPVLLALVFRLALQPREHPAAVELFARQTEFERARLQALFDVVHRRPCAAVPDDHRPAAIFAGGDNTFEVDVFERMVFGLDRQPLVGRVERGALRNGPAFEHVTDLQPEIVVVGRRVVLVHDESVAGGFDRAAGRFRRLGEVSLGSVGFQLGHGAKLESPECIDNAPSSVRQNALWFSCRRAALADIGIRARWRPRSGRSAGRNAASGRCR